MKLRRSATDNLPRFRSKSGYLDKALRDQAAAPGDGILAEPVPHRIHRLVDLATELAGTAEQVALENLAGLDEIMGADADQAEGTPVGLAGKERFGGPEHLPRPIAWRSSGGGRG